MPTVLIADDEPNIRRMVGALLGAEGYDVCDAANGTDAVAQATRGDVDVALIDLMMPGEIDGMGALKRIRERFPDMPVIMMSGRAGLSDAVNATKLGAFNFLEKPLTPEGVLLAVGSAFELQRTRRVARELREELGLAGQMVGESTAMEDVRALIARVAPTDSRVLITGESGTGKELVASAIHDGSPRRERPFVRVNCAALPRDLVESEMFGHERGAFTGATQARAGRFELAHTGTLFLDEIGDLSAEAQAKLLRAIEAREIQRVGGNKTLKVDVRVIAATNHDLQAAVKSGDFREDLYFRLAVLPIALPPLRQRAQDIPSLIAHFSEQYRKRTGQRPPVWTREAVEVMSGYAWPGNVRELANIVERVAILHSRAPVTAHTVREILFGGEASSVDLDSPPGDGGIQPLNETLDGVERRLIMRALNTARGNVSDAARMLETDRGNLYRRMKRLGIAGQPVKS
ncbi:MAG: sigma-54-dependent Fis family transcriptional regulator [Gemmatimonadaceae bacterium]|nr:sigma-54-dependent Fis family transcriptional regulator [Gemmatimonadaceae bacterium]